MIRAHDRLVFNLAAHLGRTAAEVERLSAREVGGWLRHFRRVRRAEREARERAPQGADDGALELRTLDKATLRAMFHP
jgi:hypothetical protein